MTDEQIVEAARRYQEAERAAIRGKGTLDNEYARRAELYRLLDEKYGPVEKNRGN